MNTRVGGTAEPLAADRQRYSLTFGIYNQTTPWIDVRSLSWPELATLLTQHEIGVKEGSCVVPALFAGQQRKKGLAARIGVAFQIASELDLHGWQRFLAMARRQAEWRDHPASGRC